MQDYGHLYRRVPASKLVIDFTRLGCPGLGNLFYMAYKWFLVTMLLLKDDADFGECAKTLTMQFSGTGGSSIAFLLVVYCAEV